MPTRGTPEDLELGEQQIQSRLEVLKKLKQKLVDKHTKDPDEEAVILYQDRKAQFLDNLSKLRSERERLGISLSEEDYKMSFEYAQGATLSQLEAKYNYPNHTLKAKIQEVHTELTNAMLANALQQSKSPFKNTLLKVTDKLKSTEVLNQPFLDLLSDPEDLTLSESEALFAWIYVHKGDSEEAILLSELDVGIQKANNAASSYRKVVLARALYLREKPNVAQYIRDLREKKYYSEDITKGYVQELILEQIHQVRDRGNKQEGPHLRQLIELLGKTIGAFTERIEIQEVDPSKSLDRLIEMAKVAEVRELT